VTLGWLSTLKDVATVAAAVIGGAWVYFNAFQGRVFTPRLAADVSAKLLEGRGRRFIRVDCRIKNTGLRKVSIDLDSTVVQVTELSLKGAAKFLRRGKAGETRTYPIAQRHRHLEPGSEIEDALLLFLPPHVPEGFYVELIVGAHERRWSAATALVADASHANQNEDSRDEGRPG
jgi:hypothetical protein